MNIIGNHLIAREDSHNIVKCLDSCEGLVDFTVVAVDSRPESDETFNLIKDRKNTFCYRQKWEDSFATARNDSLKTLLELRPDVNFILWVDSDDQFDTTSQGSVSHEEIRKRLEELKPEAVNNVYIYAEDSGSNNPNLSYQRLRIFAHEPGKPLEYEWSGSAHESLMCRKSSGRPTLSWNDWVLVHHRAPNHEWRAKTGRNVKMLELDLEKDPSNNRTMFYLAREYKDFGDYEKSIVMFTKYIHKSLFSLEKYQALLDIGYMYLWRNDLDSAREKAQDAIKLCPEVAFAYTLLGEVTMKLNRPDLARMYFAQAVFAPHGPVLFDFIPSRTFGPRRWLSVSCNYSNMHDEAVYHHNIAKSMARQDEGIKYNDPWLIDNSEPFPDEFSDFKFDENYNETLVDTDSFLRNSLKEKFTLDEIDKLLTLDIADNSDLILINQTVTNEILDSTNELLKDISPVVIIVRDFGDWGVKSAVARFLTRSPSVSLYRNYELSSKNPEIDKSQGIGLLIRK